jgi:hypothetical protein
MMFLGTKHLGWGRSNAGGDEKAQFWENKMSSGLHGSCEPVLARVCVSSSFADRQTSGKNGRHLSKVRGILVSKSCNAAEGAKT